MVGVAFICCTFVAKIKCHRSVNNKLPESHQKIYSKPPILEIELIW